MARGQVLGTRASPHIHISLDARYDAQGREKPKREQWSPVPFSGPHRLESEDFPALEDTRQSYHTGRTIVSTNQKR